METVTMYVFSILLCVLTFLFYIKIGYKVFNRLERYGKIE
jgi:hypothetical protein